MTSPIKNDVLFIKGEKSDYINKEDEDSLKENFLKYKINEIPNSGHWVHAENSGDFINSVENFLKP